MRTSKQSIAGVVVAALVASAYASYGRAAEMAAAEFAPERAESLEQAASESTRVVPGEVLAEQRGGDVHVNLAKTDGSVFDNTANNVVTGSNFISSGSFAGMNGIPLVVQNSGNNVLIQNATILNLQLR